MDVETEKRLFKERREGMGWTSALLARRAQQFADRDGYDIKISQQLVWNFENTAKKVPHWVRYAYAAMDASQRGEAVPAQSPALVAANDDSVEIIALDLSLSMGPGTLIEEFIEAEPVRFSLGFIQAITRTPSDRLRLVKGIGDSMESTLRSGDAVMVDINERAMTRINGIYWIDYLGTHGIKRLRPAGDGMVRVASDNPMVEDFDVPAADLRIEGRVIWFGREV